MITKPAYSSTSIVFLQPLAGNPYSPTTPPSRTEQLAALTTEAGLVYTDAVVGAAVKLATQKGVTLPGDMRGDIFTEVPSNSQVVQITYTQANPQLAQAGAQALAESYLNYRKERASRVVTAETELRNQQLASITTLLNTASTQLDAARRNNSVQAQILDLEQQVTLYANQLAQVRLLQTSADATSIIPGDIISPAVLPASPNGINPALIAVGVVLLFALFALMALLAREHFDQSIRDEDDITAAGGGPLRGTIRRWKSPDQLIPDTDGYRRLQLVLQSSQPLENHVLLLTGVPHGTDTLQVSRELATAFDDAGTPVVLVQTTKTAHEDSSLVVGLTDLLATGRRPSDVWPLLQPQGKHMVLELGTLADRWDELSLRPTLGEILNELRTDAVVLVAGPSLDTAAGVALANHATEVMLVIDTHQATVAALAPALEVMRQIHSEFAGSVLLGRAERRPAPRRAAGGSTSPGQDTRPTDERPRQDQDAPGSSPRPSTASTLSDPTPLQSNRAFSHQPRS